MASQYTQCPNCRHVIPDGTMKYHDLSVPMPCCGATGEPRLQWPNVEVYEFLRIIWDQPDNPDGRRIKIVFLSTVLEILLTNALWDLAAQDVKQRRIIEALLDGYRGRERRISLFNKLSRKARRKTLSPIFRSAGLEDFMQNWTELSTLRNRLLHGQFFGLPKRRPLIDYLSTNCLRAFSDVNNELHPAENLS